MFPYKAFALAFVLLTIVCVFTWSFVPDYISDQLTLGIEAQVVWRPDSSESVYGRFERDNHPTDAPHFMRFYFFNITNLEEVKAGGKPHLQEVGPYVYHKHRQKVDIWFDRSGRVKFKEYTYMLQVPNATADPKMDTIHTINIPLLGALEKAAKYSLETILAGYVKTMADSHNDGIFMKRTPHELLFGYEDPLLSRIAKLVPGFSDSFQLVGNMTAAEEAAKQPENVVNTGALKLSATWNQEVWNGVREVSCWNNHSETVRGTDAFQFRPFLDENSTLEVWVGDLFRSALLISKGWTESHGIRLLRFTPHPQQREPNEKYFQYIQGLMNITAPTAAGPSGSPDSSAGPFIFMANPHYCNADPTLLNNVTGLECHPDLHTTHIDVEPLTGMNLRAAKRLMVVVQYGPRYSLIEPHVIDTFLPVFWAEESGEISEEQAAQFRDMVYGTQKLESQVRSYSSMGCIVCTLLFLINVVGGCFAWGMAPKHSPGSRSWSKTGHSRRILGRPDPGPNGPLDGPLAGPLSDPLLGTSHPIDGMGDPLEDLDAEAAMRLLLQMPGGEHNAEVAAAVDGSGEQWSGTER